MKSRKKLLLIISLLLSMSLMANEGRDSKLGILKVTPITQYTCLNYNWRQSSDGSVYRTNYMRLFYYYSGYNIPAPIPTSLGNEETIVCHDEQMNPGNDSAEYARLETINSAVLMWDKSDIRFAAKPENAGKMTINKILEDRLADEYGIYTTLDIFRLLDFSNTPKHKYKPEAEILSAPLGYVMVPFRDPISGKSTCLQNDEYGANQPLQNLLREYMPKTEGLYVAEKQPVYFEIGQQWKLVHGTMFVKERDLLKYGFYIEGSLKFRISYETFHNKTIYYYWPFDHNSDPLIAGDRLAFTVKDKNKLSGQRPAGIPEYEGTTDKRIGCIPMSKY